MEILVILATSIVFLLLAGLFIYAFVVGPKLPPEANAILEDILESELPEMVVGQTGFASSGGVEIWYESILPDGPPEGTVLLVMGMGGNALMWPPSFVRALVDANYQVIRYDHRGTGMSDWMKDWNRKNPYSLADMADDAIAVLDALEIQQAHIIGLSMGGMITQEIAIRHPAKVASLTLMMTSGYVGDPDLPGLSSRFFWSSLLKGIPFLMYRIMGGEKNLIKEVIAKTVSTVGYEGLRETAEVFLYDLRKRRGVNTRAVFQHGTAVSRSGSRYEKLKELDIPTLVVHGTDDLFNPIAHGKKLAEIIPRAEALWLHGVGHVFPMPEMEKVTRSIISHFDSR
jgi:pimeloyl-ACP methyl ester carboxylesterase